MSLPTTPLNSSFLHSTDPISRARTPNPASSARNFYQLRNSSAPVLSASSNYTPNSFYQQPQQQQNQQNLHQPNPYYQFHNPLPTSPDELRFLVNNESDSLPAPKKHITKRLASLVSLFCRSAYSAAKSSTSSTGSNFSSSSSSSLSLPKSKVLYAKPRPSSLRRKLATIRSYLFWITILSLTTFFYYSYFFGSKSLFLAGQGVSTNGPWSVAYSPITPEGECKRPDTVVRDLREIYNAGFPAVKLHSSDCSILQALDRVPKLNVVMGLYPYEYQDEERPENTPKTRVQRLIASLNIQIQELVDWDQWSRIKVVVVGSGGVQQKDYSRNELITLLRHVRRVLKGSRNEPGKSERSANSVHRGFGLNHISITTAEPVQSFISQSRYNALSIDEYRAHQLDSVVKFHQLAVKAAESIKKSNSISENLSYPQIFHLDKKKSDHHSQDAIFKYDAYLQAAAEPQEDDDLCSHIDVIGLIVQPYYTNSTSPLSAGKLLERDTKFARYLCSDQFIGAAHSDRKQGNDHRKINQNVVEINDEANPMVVVLEAGWPRNANNANKVEITKVSKTEMKDSESEEFSPETMQQREALSSIVHARDPYTNKRIPVALYSWDDEVWRHNDNSDKTKHLQFGVRDQFYNQLYEQKTKGPNNRGHGRKAEQIRLFFSSSASIFNNTLKTTVYSTWESILSLFK